MANLDPKRHFTMTISTDHARALAQYARDHGYDGNIQEALRATSLMGMSADPASAEVTQRANFAYQKVRLWAMRRLSVAAKEMEAELERACAAGDALAESLE